MRYADSPIASLARAFPGRIELVGIPLRFDTGESEHHPYVSGFRGGAPIFTRFLTASFNHVASDTHSIPEARHPIPD